ncbi:MAG: hypothetical protein MUC91_05080 [Verrucomicrobia bacterium]|nr:hypothetical protein [Verrucomicrobiota bacterium]
MREHDAVAHGPRVAGAMLVCLAMLTFFVTERHGPMKAPSASEGLNVAAPAPDCFNDWVAPVTSNSNFREFWFQIDFSV